MAESKDREWLDALEGVGNDFGTDDSSSTEGDTWPLRDATSQAEQVAAGLNEMFFDDDDDTETTPNPSHEDSEPLHADQNQHMNYEDISQTDPAGERLQADQNQKTSTEKTFETSALIALDLQNSRSFVKKRKGVFFAFNSHPGTTLWRNSVDMCSVNHQRWSDVVLNQVKARLKSEMGTDEFFVCRGVGGKKKLFKDNGDCWGSWELADEKEIIAKTKERFYERRKPRSQPKRGASQTIRRQMLKATKDRDRCPIVLMSSLNKRMQNESSPNNVGSLVVRVLLYPKNFAWDDSVWVELKKSLVDDKIDHGVVRLAQNGITKCIEDDKNMVSLILRQIVQEMSSDDSNATSGKECSRQCEPSTDGGPQVGPSVEHAQGSNPPSSLASNRDTEPAQVVGATQAPSISTDLAAGRSETNVRQPVGLSTGLVLMATFVLIVSIGLATHGSIKAISAVTQRSLEQITSYLSTIKARGMISCGLNEYPGVILNHSTDLATHRFMGEATNTLLNNPSTTLKDTIKARGMLLCGLYELTGMSMLNRSTGTWSGFEVDLCRAVGAAIFGEDGHVNFTALEAGDRFITLQSGNVDLIAAMATYTMEHDVYEPNARAGFTFSVPYLYGGLVFAGAPRFVACAEKGWTTGNCSDVRVCVRDGTTHVDVVKGLFADSSVIKTAPTNADFYNNYAKGLCNVLAGEQFDLAANDVLKVGYNGDYSFSTNVYSKEPYSLATRDDDPEWSDYVNWVFLALLTAERQNITQQTARSTVINLGPAIDTSDLPFYQAVATVGNYGEMYHRHLESIVPRAPSNQQNIGTSPLIYSYPIGNHAAVGPKPVANGALDTILKRGHLLCGIGELEFFSDFDPDWRGFNVDYCRAISAAIFNGTREPIFVPLAAETRFKQLQKREIDVLLWGTTWSYNRDVYEPSASSGFTFSTAIFYSGLQFGGVPMYHKCAENVNVQGECSALKICVKDKTVCLKDVRRLFPDEFIFPQPDDDHLYDCLRNNSGNVIAADGFSAATEMVRSRGYHGPYETNTKLFSGQSSAIVTRQDDPQWSSFVNWVIMATFYAEEQNITQATYHRMPATNLFGTNFSSMLQNAIRAVGSHGEMLTRNTKGTYDIGAVNWLNTKPFGPQHFPPGGLLGH